MGEVLVRLRAVGYPPAASRGSWPASTSGRRVRLLLTQAIRRLHGLGQDAEAAGLLQAYLPEAISGELRWSSLKWQPASFIDDRLRDSESDLLYAIERKADGAPAWLYVLLEHQSTPDPWLRLRLLKYQEGRQEGRQEGQLETIERLVRTGVAWSTIEAATGIDEETFDRLKHRVHQDRRRPRLEPVRGEPAAAQQQQHVVAHRGRIRKT